MTLRLMGWDAGNSFSKLGHKVDSGFFVTGSRFNYLVKSCYVPNLVLTLDSGNGRAFQGGHAGTQLCIGQQVQSRARQFLSPRDQRLDHLEARRRFLDFVAELSA